MNDEPLINTRTPERKTLRDEFAMAAMNSLVVTFTSVAINGEDAWDEMVTARAYKIADAMLAERAK